MWAGKARSQETNEKSRQLFAHKIYSGNPGRAVMVAGGFGSNEQIRGIFQTWSIGFESYVEESITTFLSGPLSDTPE